MDSDQKFPHLSFTPDSTPTQRGHQHGESYAEAIKELCGIRRELMLAKSPHLGAPLAELAGEQYEITKKIFPAQWSELEAIRESSKTTIEDIVILNNYTDFRDIQLPDEGCTTLGLSKNTATSGQTWDMHSSAKNYVCTMGVEGQWQAFSLVGCLGMMGANSSSLFVGVNNLNTQKAKTGVIWPALIRSLLETSDLTTLRSKLLATPVTSGHNYLISDGTIWENWEIGATFQKLSGEINPNKADTKETQVIYHTNHCLNSEAIKEEVPLALNSTSLNRFELIAEKASQLSSTEDVISVLQNHDSYPKSLCSHFQSNATDPSTTCGGAVFNHRDKEFFLWRCCPKDEQMYISRKLKL